MNNKKELKEKLSNAAHRISDILSIITTEEDIDNKGIDKIMLDVLKVLGSVSKADRCYIWKNYIDSKTELTGFHYMEQVYEWADGVEAVQDSELIEYVPYDPVTYDTLSAKNTINAIVKDLDEYNQSILEPQGIKSILIAPIHLKDYFWGFIGFDNCQTEEVWEDFEEEILLNISIEIGEFIHKFKI